VEDGQFRFPRWIRNGNGEEAGIFVIHVAEFDAVARSKGRQTQALPVKEALVSCRSVIEVPLTRAIDSMPYALTGMANAEIRSHDEYLSPASLKPPGGLIKG